MRRSERRNNLQICPRWYSNTGGSDLWSNTLTLDHGGATRERERERERERDPNWEREKFREKEREREREREHRFILRHVSPGHMAIWYQREPPSRTTCELNWNTSWYGKQWNRKKTPQTQKNKPTNGQILRYSKFRTLTNAIQLYGLVPWTLSPRQCLFHTSMVGA